MFAFFSLWNLFFGVCRIIALQRSIHESNILLVKEWYCFSFFCACIWCLCSHVDFFCSLFFNFLVSSYHSFFCVRFLISGVSSMGVCFLLSLLPKKTVHLFFIIYGAKKNTPEILLNNIFFLFELLSWEKGQFKSYSSKIMPVRMIKTKIVVLTGSGGGDTLH